MSEPIQIINVEQIRKVNLAAADLETRQDIEENEHYFFKEWTNEHTFWLVVILAICFIMQFFGRNQSPK